MMSLLVTMAMEKGKNKKNNSVGDITVEWISCDEVEITSTKDISNIVYEVDGVETKIDSLSGHSYTLSPGGTITAVWVKAGNNKSGDGPGYGEKFELPDASLEVFITVDDAFQIWIDGQEYNGPNQSAWTHGDTFAAQVAACTDHTVAVHSVDVGYVINAMIAVVSVDGQNVSVTGDGSWKAVGAAPTAGWEQPSYNDSMWPTASVCSTNSPWGTYWPAPFYAEGAQWIWDSSNCSPFPHPSESWARLNVFAEISGGSGN